MKKKILLADGIKNALDREQSILNRASFEIFTVLSGREALALHRAHAMNLIISSLELSDMHGDKLCTLIRQDNDLKGVSILMICANDPLCIKRATHCGANAYITKPFHSEQLSDKVTNLISIPRRQKCRVLLKGSVEEKQSDGFFYCTTRDISISGIMIETEQSLDEGDVLSLSFVLPSFGHIMAKGEIRRTEKKGAVSGYGILFRDLSLRQQEAIEAFILSRTELKH